MFSDLFIFLDFDKTDHLKTRTAMIGQLVNWQKITLQLYNLI